MKIDLKHVRQDTTTMVADCATTFAGVFLFTILAISRLDYAVRQADWMGVLLAVQAVLAVILLARRRRAQAEAPLYQRLVAWCSAFLPLAMETAVSSWFGRALTAGGLLFSLWGLWVLGRAFGISPADRGLVVEGPYRFLRHPIYAAESVVIAGAVLGAWTLRNLVLFIVLLASKLLRIDWEERIIPGYFAYAGRVRWRLVPGVW